MRKFLLSIIRSITLPIIGKKHQHILGATRCGHVYMVAVLKGGMIDCRYSFEFILDKNDEIISNRILGLLWSL